MSGATGNFGSATVATALAIGALGDRARPQRTHSQRSEAAIRRSARARAALSAPESVARAAIMSVRPYGRAVLMGGVGTLGGENLALPYPWIMRNNITVMGQFMYQPEAVAGMVGLIRGGLLDLEHYAAATEFVLEEANKAVAHAAVNAGPFKLSVLRLDA